MLQLGCSHESTSGDDNTNRNSQVWNGISKIVDALPLALSGIDKTIIAWDFQMTRIFSKDTQDYIQFSNNSVSLDNGTTMQILGLIGFARNVR